MVRHFSHLAHILFHSPSWSTNCFVADVRQWNTTIEIKASVALVSRSNVFNCKKKKKKKRRRILIKEVLSYSAAWQLTHILVYLVVSRCKIPKPLWSIHSLHVYSKLFHICGRRWQSSGAVADSLWPFACLFPCIIQSFPEVTAALYMQARRPRTRHTNVM